MSRIYTPDGEIRTQNQVRESAGGGRVTFKVNQWSNEASPSIVTSKEEDQVAVLKAAKSPQPQRVVAGKSTDWDNSGEMRISQRGGKGNRIKHISGNDIFADVPQPLQQRPTTGMKARDLYGQSHSFASRTEEAGDAPVFGTASGGRYSPGYKQRTVTANKKRDLAGSGGIWFADETTPPPSGSVNGVDPAPRPVRRSSTRVTGGGVVSVKLG